MRVWDVDDDDDDDNSGDDGEWVSECMWMMAK